MSQINLLDAIKMVQDCMEQFTDMQLRKFNIAVTEEINKRKDKNNYNPGQRAVADDAGKKKKDIEKKIS